MASFTGRTGGGVSSVTAGDASITIGGTAAAPTVVVNQAFAFNWTAAHQFVVTDANRTTNTDVLTIAHITSDPAFGGNGMATSILFQLEADDGAQEDAGRVGIKWVDASNASLDTAFSVSLLRNGAFSEQFVIDSGSTTRGIAYRRDGVTSSGLGLVMDLACAINGVGGLVVENQNSGGSASATLTAVNDSGDRINSNLYSSGVGGTFFGVTAARLASVYTTGSAPLVMGTNSAQTVTLGTNATGRWQIGASTGDLVPFVNDTYDIGTSALRVMDVWTGGRVHFAKGADVASANDMTLGGGGISFDITGAVQINTIASTTWQAGDIVILQFDGAPTVKNLTAGAGAQIELAGSMDFIASAGDELGLKYNGTYWREIFRTVI